MKKHKSRMCTTKLDIIIRLIGPLCRLVIEIFPKALLRVRRKIQAILRNAAPRLPIQLEVLFRRHCEHAHLELAHEEGQDLFFHGLALIGEAVVGVEGGALEADASMAGAGVEFVAGTHDEQRRGDEVGV